MPREAFIKKRFNRSSVVIISHANSIISDYLAQGFRLTLRQLYYQFVARELIPNTPKDYKRLGSVINDARLAGLIDWSAIEDRTRNVRKLPDWSKPSSIVEGAAAQYREDLWRSQRVRPEIWIEKEALVGVVEPVCERWRVPLFACRGYTSQSEQWRAGKRFADVRRAGQRPVIFHLGDHDPSGIDMTRDNRVRLEMFARQGVEVVRLALNMDQIEQYDPPPNPAKETDSRAGGYIEKFGASSWELDALEPTVIDALLEEAIVARLDRKAWDADKAAEAENRSTLEDAATHWPKLVDFMREAYPG